jgi:hypothetical protein
LRLCREPRDGDEDGRPGKLPIKGFKRCQIVVGDPLAQTELGKLQPDARYGGIGRWLRLLIGGVRRRGGRS